MRYYLGLGSNLGQKRRNLDMARSLLEESGVRIRKASSLYLTQPLGYPDQPWFLNQVLRVESSAEPGELLGLVKRVEKRMRRQPGRRNGPRVIDIDVLLAGRRVMVSAPLTLPHPRLARRRFVLLPLVEIAPRAVHPVLKKTARRLLDETGDASGVVKMPEVRRHGR